MDRIQLFETFARVVEGGSLSSAARQLGCSLSAVSRRIDDLEAQLGAQLLDRSSRALRVTPAGERLLPHAATVRQAMEAARHAVVGDNARNDVVRLSVPAALGLTRILPAIATLLSKSPSLRVEVLIDNDIVSLDREGIDVVVRAGVSRLPASNELIARSLGTFQFLFCATPAFLARYRAPERPEDLAAMPTVAHVGTRGRRIVVRRGPEEVAVPLRPLVWTNDMLAMRCAVRDGIGVGVLPEWLVEDDLAKKTLRAVLTNWSTPTGEAWVAYRRGGRNRAALRAVVAHLAASLRIKTTRA